MPACCGRGVGALVRGSRQEAEGATPCNVLCIHRCPIFRPAHATLKHRSFPALNMSPTQAVYDWVDSLETVTALHYSLATTFPRRVYGAGE